VAGNVPPDTAEITSTSSSKRRFTPFTITSVRRNSSSTP
jgi:hypothetical protein